MGLLLIFILSAWTHKWDSCSFLYSLIELTNGTPAHFYTLCLNSQMGLLLIFILSDWTRKWDYTAHFYTLCLNSQMGLLLIFILSAWTHKWDYCSFLYSLLELTNGTPAHFYTLCLNTQIFLHVLMHTLCVHLINTIPVGTNCTIVLLI